MVRRQADPIAVVEAAYDMAATDAAWTGGLAVACTNVLPRTPHGVIAYHFVLGEQVRIEHPAGSIADGPGVQGIQRMQALLDRLHSGQSRWLTRLRGKFYQNFSRALLQQSADRVTMSEHVRGPDWVFTLGVPQVCDVFLLKSAHLDEPRVTMIAAGLAEKRHLTVKERALYMMLSAHIKAGFRLRRRLDRVTDRLVPAERDGAVLDGSSFQLLHAEGEAQAPERRQTLRQLALQVDRARSRRHGRDEQALEIWQGLLDGRWSLVEQFDSDGKRFLVAHRNVENVSDPRGLTQMECRVVALAVRGYANKVIGYHLGVAEGTVSSHLHRALIKLHIRSRAELVRILGSDYPLRDRSGLSPKKSP